MPFAPLHHNVLDITAFYLPLLFLLPTAEHGPGGGVVGIAEGFKLTADAGFQYFS